MADIDLSTLKFFEGFSTGDLERIRDMAEEVTAEPGAVLMEQGDVGQEAFVICDGQAAVEVGGQRVVTIGRGSIAGEMALLELRPRSATVRAVTELTLLSFDNKRFHKLLESLPEAAERVAELTRQHREENSQL